MLRRKKDAIEKGRNQEDVRIEYIWEIYNDGVVSKILRLNCVKLVVTLFKILNENPRWKACENLIERCYNARIMTVEEQISMSRLVHQFS